LEDLTSQKLLTPQQTSLTWATGDSHTSSLQLGKPGTANLQNVKTETGHTLGSNTGTFQGTEFASAEATNGHAHQGELGKTSAESEYSQQITSGNKEFRTGEPQETELRSDTSKSEYSEEMKMGSDELHSSEFSVGNGSSRILDFVSSSESGEGVVKSEISQSITTEQSQTRGGLKIDSSQEGEGESEESQTEIVQESKKESGEFQTGSEIKSREQLIEAGLHKSQSEESQQAEVNSGEALTASTQPVFAKSETSQIDSVGRAEIRPEQSQSESSQSVNMRLEELQSKVDSDESQTESVHPTRKEWGELQYQNAQPNSVIAGELQSGGAQQIGTGPQSEIGSGESQTERVHSTRTEWRELQQQSTRPSSVIGGELQSGGAQQIVTRPQSESQTERVHSTRTEWRELQPQSTRPSSVIGGELQSGGAQQIGTKPQSESQTERVHSTRTEWRELQPQSAQSNSAIREDFTQYSKPIEMGSVEFQNENLQQILMGSDKSRTADIQQSGDLKIGDAEKTLATDNSFSTTLEDEILNSEDSIPMDFGSGEMKMESFENEEAGYPQYVPEIVASGEVITDSQSDGSDSQLLKVLTPQKFIGKGSDGRYDGPLSFSRSYPYNFENMDLTSDSNLLGLAATRTPASANLLGLAATRTPAPVGADLNAQRFYPVKIEEPNVPFRVLTDASLGSINQLQIQDQEQQYQFQPKVSECGNDGKVLVKMKMDIMDKDGEIANMEKNIEVDLSSYDTESNVAGFDKHLALLIRDYYGDRLIRQCKKITKQVSSRKLMNPYLRSYQDVLQNEDEAFYPKKQFFYPPSEELGKFYLGPDNRYYIAQHNSNIPAFEKASLFRKISSGIQNAFRFLTNN
jgi:hypothetical protein